MTAPFPLPFSSMPNAISNEDYHRGERYKGFVSSSILKLLEISPNHLRYVMDHPEEAKSISLQNELKGSVYHDMLASLTNCGNMTDFYKTWEIFKPPINQSTGKHYGQDSQKFLVAYTQFQEQNSGRRVCSQAEVDLAIKMIKVLKDGNNPLSADIRQLIKYGKAETSHFCEYEGGLFKFRTDLETSSNIVDWKSCAFEFPKIENWSRQVINMGYHISAAFYQFFDAVINGRWRKFYWVAQEKEPPYDFNIIDASNWAWEIHTEPDGTQIPEAHIGAMIFHNLMQEYLHCTELNQWPGYYVFTEPKFYGGREHRIAISPVPGWEQNRMIQFYHE